MATAKDWQKQGAEERKNLIRELHDLYHKYFHTHSSEEQKQIKEIKEADKKNV